MQHACWKRSAPQTKGNPYPSLLVKPEKLKVDLNIECVAMNIPNDFIVGYGLDYDSSDATIPTSIR